MKKRELLKGINLLERFKQALEPILSDLELHQVKVSEFAYKCLEFDSDGNLHLIFFKK